MRSPITVRGSTLCLISRICGLVSWLVDVLLHGLRTALASDDPRQEAITNLQNWVENTSSLAEEETTYLSLRMDLMTMHANKDAAFACLMPFVESALRQLYGLFKKVSDAC